MQTFWMIYREGGNAPAYQHYALEEAKKEAVRIARLEPGKKVYLLQATNSCFVDDVTWEEAPDSDIPF